jgi:hypothetical protein
MDNVVIIHCGMRGGGSAGVCGGGAGGVPAADDSTGSTVRLISAIRAADKGRDFPSPERNGVSQNSHCKKGAAGDSKFSMTENEAKTGESTVLCTRLVGLPGATRIVAGILGVGVLALNVWHFYDIAQVLRTPHPLIIDPTRGRIVTLANAICALFVALVWCFRYVFILDRAKGLIFEHLEFAIPNQKKGLLIWRRIFPLEIYHTVEVDCRSKLRGLSVTLRGDSQNLRLGSFATDVKAAEKLGAETAAATGLKLAQVAS